MKVRVWNDNIYPHKEPFREQVIEIPAKGFVVFDAIEDAIEFKGQFTTLRTDGEKNPLPQFFKMIRLEPIDGSSSAGDDPLICHATGKVAANAAELAKMNAEHADKLDSDSKKQVETLAALEAENAALKARLAAAELAQAAIPEPDDDQRRAGRPKR